MIIKKNVELRNFHAGVGMKEKSTHIYVLVHYSSFIHVRRSFYEEEYNIFNWALEVT